MSQRNPSKPLALKFCPETLGTMTSGPFWTWKNPGTMYAWQVGMPEEARPIAAIWISVTLHFHQIIHKYKGLKPKMGTKICRTNLWPLTVPLCNITSVFVPLTANEPQSELSGFQSSHDMKKAGFGSPVTMEPKLFCSRLKLSTKSSFTPLPHHLTSSHAHLSLLRHTSLFQDYSWFKIFDLKKDRVRNTRYYGTKFLATIPVVTLTYHF